MSDLSGGTTIAGYPALHLGNLNPDTMGNLLSTPVDATGSSNVYSATVPSMSSYIDLLPLTLRCDVTSNGAVSININGLGAKPLLDYYNQAVTDIQANSIISVTYNAKANSGSGAFTLRGKGGGGTATASTILAGYTATVTGGKVTGTMPDMSGTNIGNSDSTAFTNSANLCGGTAINSYVGAFDIYIPKGFYNGTSTSRIHIPNLIPSNIKAGVNVGWNGKSITGTFTSDATAVASDMIAGKTAYVNATLVTGNIPLRTNTGGDGGGANWWLNYGLAYTSNRVFFKPVPNDGTTTYAYKGDCWVCATEASVATAIGLTSAKIAKGQTVLGTAGTYTADATATAGLILTGYTAYVNGAKVTGTMADRGNYQMAGGIGGNGSGATAYTALNNIPEGYYHKDGQDWAPEVRILNTDLANYLGITSAKLTRDASVLGITGTGYKVGAVIGGGSFQANWTRSYGAGYYLGQYHGTANTVGFFGCSRYRKDGHVYIFEYNSSNSTSWLSCKPIGSDAEYYRVKLPFYTSDSYKKRIKIDYLENCYFIVNNHLMGYYNNGTLKFNIALTAGSNDVAVSSDSLIYFMDNGLLRRSDRGGNIVTIGSGFPTSAYAMEFGSDGWLYIGFYSGGAMLKKVSAINGSVAWSVMLDSWGTTRFVKPTDDGYVYACGDDNLRRYDTNGNLVWNFDLSSSASGACSMDAMQDGGIAFVSGYKLNGFAGVNSSGTKLWNYTETNMTDYKAPTQMHYDPYDTRIYTKDYSNEGAIQAYKAPFSDAISSVSILS